MRLVSIIVPMVGRRSLTGSGFLGGDWNNATSNATVADRNNSANTNTNRNNNNGARLAKTVLFLMEPVIDRRAAEG